MSRVPSPSGRLAELLRHPEAMSQLSLVDWDLLLRQGRVADVLARLCELAEDAGQEAALPPQVWRHLKAAQLVARRQHVELGFEAQHVRQALAAEGVPLVLLKGAAYVLAGLQAGKGRMVSDIDLLIPRERLADVESALMKAGWLSSTRDSYDQHYYRRWMHEIPALRRVHRGSVLDVHHSVVPPTAGYGLDVQKMLGAVVPVQGMDGVFVLADMDMVLHSAVHLMHEGELEMGFRGLVDLDALVREFSSADASFWDRLHERAIALNLQRPAFLALRYTQKFLGTAIPQACLERLQAASPRMGAMRLAWLDALYERGLRPVHASFNDRYTNWARSALYIRSHWLRMPPHLLIPHLLRKSGRRLIEGFKTREETNHAQA